MTIVCVSMVKDELDIVPFMYDQFLKNGVEHFVIADNGSTDGTKDFLQEFQSKNKNVIIMDDKEEAFYQDRKMMSLCNIAREKFGATFIIPSDADELWYSLDPKKTLAEVINSCQYDIMRVDYWNMIATGPVINPLKDIVMKDTIPVPNKKVCFRWSNSFLLHMGNHEVDNHPGTRHPEPVPVAIRHYMYRSLEHYKRKSRNGKRALEKSGHDIQTGNHWHVDGSLSDDMIKDKWIAMSERKDLIFDPAFIHI